MNQPTRQNRPRRPLLRRPVVQGLLIMLVVLLAVGLWAFEPWRLWTRSTVDEALPATRPSSAAEPDVPVAPAAPAEPEILAQGQFVTQEHRTVGVVRVIGLADGSRYVRLEGFSTSDGPDLHVWITDQTAGGEWGKYDDGRYLPLGKLKATDGNQNYAIPPDADLAGLASVVIWCDRFNVAFGSAPLAG